MKARTGLLRSSLRLLAVLVALGIARSAPAQFAVAQSPVAQSPVAQGTGDLTAFRENFDAMMAGYERIAAAMGNTAREERAHVGREAMRKVTDAQLVKTFGENQIPDIYVGAAASQFLASRVESQRKAAENRVRTPLTPGFPGPVALVGGCNGVDISADTRYALLITKEVANSILAAAAWVCNEDILGENGSAACIPLAIAADIANGFFDTATFCAGEITGNQVDANFNRLDHIHNDLAAVQAKADAIDTHLTNVNTEIDARIANLDTHLTNVDTHIANEFSALDAHMVALFATVSNQLMNSTALLGADLKQVMKLELTPEGQRQIVPAVLTCTGTNCPDVLTQCTGKGGACSWNNVGPLP